MAESTQIVQKLWNYCNVLRDDGMSYGDYVEQLTYLLFLKMADERTRSKEKVPGVFSLGTQKPFRRSQSLIRLEKEIWGQA